MAVRFYATTPLTSKFLVVPYREVSAQDGFVLTAYFTIHDPTTSGLLLAGAAINVALNLLLIPRYSLNGAAAAKLAAEVTVCLLMAATFASVLSGSGGSPLGEEPR